MGILLLSMEWSFIFYQKCWNVLHCIFHYYLGIDLVVSSHILTFAGLTGFLFEDECWRSGDFSMDYFTMFAVFASYCVFTSPVCTSVSCLHSHILNDVHQATQRILTASIWIEAHYVFWGHRTPPSTHTNSPVIEGHKQTSILVVKLLRALWLHLSTLYLSLCKARACNDAFFSFSEYFSYDIKMFLSASLILCLMQMIIY